MANFNFDHLGRGLVIGALSLLIPLPPVMATESGSTENNEPARAILQPRLRPLMWVAESAWPAAVSWPSYRPWQREGRKVPGRRSPQLAAFLSAAIPGAGEVYAGSYLKGVVFLGVEVGAWVAYAHFRGRGSDLRDEYRAFALANWREERYWSWLAQVSGCSDEDKTCLKEYERNNFSHHLPDEQDHEYFENIGKYDQFNAGWIDSESGLGMMRDSDYREEYTLMRKDSNDQFRRATNMSAIALLNHVLSAFDAAWTSARHNRALQAELRLVPTGTDLEPVPSLSLRMAW